MDRFQSDSQGTGERTMNRHLLRRALELLDRHQPVVMATVVAARGSVPGKVGATLLLTPDERFYGTVGGAGLEEKVKLLAKEALRTQMGSLHHFDLMGWKEGGLDSRCGGSVDIAIQYLAPSPHVLIWGGGHVAEALSRILDVLGYDYSVADDRADFVMVERFPRARHLWVVSPRDLPARLRDSQDRFSHAYLLGYDAKKDEEVARVLLPSFEGRVGLIASRTKRELTLRNLRDSGLPSEVVGRLRSPVGIPLGGDSPAEIALSIAAEIVQDWHQGHGSEAKEVIDGEPSGRSRKASD